MPPGCVTRVLSGLLPPLYKGFFFNLPYCSLLQCEFVFILGFVAVFCNKRVSVHVPFTSSLQGWPLVSIRREVGLHKQPEAVSMVLPVLAVAQHLWPWLLEACTRAHVVSSGFSEHSGHAGLPLLQKPGWLLLLGAAGGGGYRADSRGRSHPMGYKQRQSQILGFKAHVSNFGTSAEWHSDNPNAGCPLQSRTGPGTRQLVEPASHHALPSSVPCISRLFCECVNSWVTC